MAHYPETFTQFDSGWVLVALNPEAVPEEYRSRLSAGIPASVPGEAALDLYNAGIIGDQFDSDNEEHQQWIGDIDWLFSCQFTWQDDGSERHDITAYGLDTIAEIELNGRPLGSSANFHRCYRWDANQLLRPGNNRLDVKFTSPIRASQDRQRILGYYPHTEHHAFNQIRKPAYSFGWDWGVDSANAGIVAPIGIDAWSGTRIRSVRPLVDVEKDGTGVLNLHVSVERSKVHTMNSFEIHHSAVDAHDGDPSIPVKVSIAGQELQTIIKPGRETAEMKVRIPKVNRWWPIGYGDQYLYNLTVETPESRWHRRVGFRTIHAETSADAIGRPFQLVINGLPIHARGYNWVPADAYLSRVSNDNYARGIRDLKESNSNMVRVWGGGVYENDKFYELCDETGILVWQDFMFACAAYPEDSCTYAEVEAEVREQIIRLSAHPSLVVWNGSNENYTAYADWGGIKQALRDDDLAPSKYGYGEKGWGDLYYSQLIPSLLSELDPTRVYLPSSPMSFSKYTSPNVDTDGTMHIWDVWNREDYRKFAEYMPRFADEFGYQSPPSWSTLTSVVHDNPLDPFGKEMLVHQKANNGNIKLARGMRSHLTEGRIDDVNVYKTNNDERWLIPSDHWDNMEDWHWACQLQQAQAIRFGVEYMRSLEPVNAGTLIWQLNDDWPVVSWSAVDFDGHRKPLWYASQDFFAPRLAVIRRHVSREAWRTESWEGKRPSPDCLILAIENDMTSPWEGSWNISRITLGGKLLAKQRINVSLKSNDHKIFQLDDSVSIFGNSAEELLIAEPSNSDFKRVIYNPAEVIDQDLKPSPFEASIRRGTSGYNLSIVAKTYVRDLFCMVDKVSSNAVIDGGMQSLLPGDTITWHIDCPEIEEPTRFLDSSVLRSANSLKR